MTRSSEAKMRALRAALLTGLLCLSGAPAAQAQACKTASSAPHTELGDRIAIEALTVKYSYLLDHGRATELAELFTPDAVFDNPNLGDKMIGRPAIAAYYAKRAAIVRTTRHVSTNLYVEFDDPNHAHGARVITYYRGDGAVPPFPAKTGSIGEYTEQWKRCEDGRWRFASRKQQIIFGAGDAPAGKP
jgi:ketosteroid isomerase-like protein